MKHKLTSLLFALSIVSAILFSSCQNNLESESGLYDNNVTKLEHTYKLPVDGFWVTDQPSPHLGKKKGIIYIAPIDVKLIEKEHPDYAGALSVAMRQSLIKEISLAILEKNKINRTNWTVSTQKQGADICIEVAVVKLKTQMWIMRALNAIGGWFVPVPGVSNAIGYFTSGSIGIEVCVTNMATGKPALIFKDSNRKSTRLYKKNAYTEVGHAYENLDFWAKSIANIIRTVKFDKNGHNTIKKMIDDRSSGGVIKSYFKTAI